MTPSFRDPLRRIPTVKPAAMRGLAALRRAAMSLAAIGLVLGLAACRQDPLLWDVEVAPDSITPDRDGDRDVAAIRYRIGAPAELSIELIASDGTQHVFRDARPRQPRGEPYEAFFGGVIDGAMLPDDRYVLRFEAVPVQGGEPVVIERSLEVRGGDTTPPVLAGFDVLPRSFTPNQDGLGDRVAISYRLDEPAEVRIWLEEADGDYVTDILEDVDSAIHAGEPGPHQYDFDAGVDADAPPPPDGEYRIVGEARDLAGNIHRQELPLTIIHGGQPRAALTGDVQWSDTVVPLGATLSFSVTVENVGGTPIRTFGPEPGFVYDSDSSFNQLAPEGYLILARNMAPDPEDMRAYRADSLRVLGSLDTEPVELDLVAPAVDAQSEAQFAGSSGRVMLSMEPQALAAMRSVVMGTALEPSPDPDESDPDSAAGRAGESPSPARTRTAEDNGAEPESPSTGSDSMTICGQVSMDDQPLPGAEVFAFELDGDAGRRTVADDEGRYCFDDLPLPSEPDRRYSRSSGAFRVGLEYDEKVTGLDWPFRWQLGPTARLDVCAPDNDLEGVGSQGKLYLCLQPGAVVEVFGGLRFKEAPARRTTNVFLALLHEDVRTLQQPYGVQRIRVEYDAR